MKQAIFAGLIGMAVAVAGCAGPSVKPLPTDAAADATKPLMTWKDLLSRPKPMPDATVRYGADALQVVDVWKPAGAKYGRGPHPAVVMIHGGCWQTGIAERDIMNWIAGDLRAHGVGVWNIEYRGVDRGGGYPGPISMWGLRRICSRCAGANMGSRPARPWWSSAIRRAGI